MLAHIYIESYKVITPMTNIDITPQSIKIQEDGLGLKWHDGHQTVLPFRFLRGNCGCAVCVDEMTHTRKVGVEDVDPDVRAEDFIEVGNYAVEILWSDLHYEGIYPFKLLRQLCTCPECAVNRQPKS